MKLTIHRGTREIGGNCIEIQSRGRRIFFDLGITLVDPGGGRFGLGGGNGTSGRELLDTGTLPPHQWRLSVGRARRISGKASSYPTLTSTITVLRVICMKASGAIWAKEPDGSLKSPACFPGQAF